MAQSDNFINEVTEEVRRDRMFRFLKRYGWIVAVVGVVGVGAAAWYEWNKYTNRSSAQAFGDEMLAALQGDNPASALANVQGTGQQAALARMSQAASMVEDGRGDEAVTVFQSVAADGTLPASLRDLASLKAVLTGAMPAADRDAVLARLAAPGAPFRALAMEQQAMALAAAGQSEPAIAKLRELLTEPGLTPGLQQRASEMIVALGGQSNDTAAQ